MRVACTNIERILVFYAAKTSAEMRKYEEE